MSEITLKATVQHGDLSAFRAEVEKMRPTFNGFKEFADKQAATLRLFGQAYARSAKAKKEEAKKRLVALLNLHAPWALRYLKDSPTPLGEVFTLEPHRQTLERLAHFISSQAPPRDTAFRTEMLSSFNS